MNQPVNKPPATSPRRLSDLKNDDLRAAMQNIDAINTDLNRPTIEFPVETFRRDFLPYFAGDFPATDQVVAAWLGVAKNLFKSVGLTDSSGRIVVVVPALAVNNVSRPLDVKRRTHADPDSAMSMAQRAASLNPNLGMSQVHNRLAARFRMFAGRADPELIQQWDTLFNFFGIEKKKPVQPGASPAAKPDELGDDLDFDAL